MSGNVSSTYWRAKYGETASLNNFLEVDPYCTYALFTDSVEVLKESL